MLRLFSTNKVKVTFPEKSRNVGEKSKSILLYSNIVEVQIHGKSNKNMLKIKS